MCMFMDSSTFHNITDSLWLKRNQCVVGVHRVIKPCFPICSPPVYRGPKNEVFESPLVLDFVAPVKNWRSLSQLITWRFSFEASVIEKEAELRVSTVLNDEMLNSQSLVIFGLNSTSNVRDYVMMMTVKFSQQINRQNWTMQMSNKLS